MIGISKKTLKRRPAIARESNLHKNQTRILLAESNTKTWNSIRHLLSLHHHLETVSSGDEVLKLASKNPFDLILLDVRIQGMEEFELLKQLRSNSNTNTVPVILLSAQAEEEEEEEEERINGLQMGADDYLTKPFSANEFLARITSRLEMSRLRRENEEQLNQILESIKDGFVALDSQWRFAYINSEAERILGRSRSQLLGRILWEELPDNIGLPFEKSLRMVILSKQANVFETQDPSKKYWFENRVFPRNDGGVSIFFHDITERKRIEQTLRESENRKTAILFAAIDAIITMDYQGKVLNCNPAVERIFGYPYKRLIGQPLADFLIPERLRQRHYEGLARYLATGKNQVLSKRIEMPALHADGHEFPVEISITRVADIEPPVFTATLRDISERKEYEKILLQNEERFRTMADNAPALIWISGTDKLCTWFNKPWLDFVGRPLEKELGNGWAENVHPEDFARCLEIYVSSFDARKPFRMDYRLRRHDGEYRWILDNGIPLYGSDKEFAGYIGSCIDITDHKQTAANLEFQKYALDEAAIVAITDVKGTITYVNDKFCQISGYSRQELMGQNHRIINSEFHPQEFFQEMYKTIAHGKVWRNEIRNRRKDGSFYWVDTTIVPALGQNGRPERYVSIRTDITERKHVEESIKEYAEELKRSNRDLEQFASIASHDLKEPLRIVSVYTDLLSRKYKGKLDDRADEFMRYIIESISKMRALIHDLLVFSKVGKENKHMTEVESRMILEETLKSLDVSIKEHGATINYNGLPRITADDVQIGQLFQNLISNAIKFHSKEPPVIDIKAESVNDEHIFSVKDNGIGIPQEYYLRIFDIFRRLYTQEEYPGTGIGLAICKKVVDNHGGRIWVKSMVGEGSTFYFTIPKTGLK